MTTLSDPPKGGFRLSMLINDTRYRSYTFQFIALIALIAAFGLFGKQLDCQPQGGGSEHLVSVLGRACGLRH